MDTFVAANAVLSLFSKNYMELKKELPIRPSEMGLLNIIAEIPGPHTPVMLAQMLHVSKPMITAHLTALSKKGYITKQPCKKDRRAYYILPTGKALELVRCTKLDTTAQLEQLRSGMGQEKFDLLVGLLQEANPILAAIAQKE